MEETMISITTATSCRAQKKNKNESRHSLLFISLSCKVVSGTFSFTEHNFPYFLFSLQKIKYLQGFFPSSFSQTLRLYSTKSLNLFKFPLILCRKLFFATCFELSFSLTQCVQLSPKFYAYFSKGKLIAQDYFLFSSAWLKVGYLWGFAAIVIELSIYEFFGDLFIDDVCELWVSLLVSLWCEVVVNINQWNKHRQRKLGENN